MPSPWMWLATGLAGGVLCAAAAAWGVTRAQIRRARRAERLAHAARHMAEIGAMTGGLAHEIRNPLSTIGMNAQLIREGIAELEADPASTARLVRRAETLEREVERLRGILVDFLEYAGEPRLDRARVDLNTLVDELADFYMPQAQRHGVRVRTDLAPGPLHAHVDAAHVKQAVLNLMLNAVQAMAGQQGDRDLILRTASLADSSREPMASIHVIDTGPGIARDVADRIFQPYFTTRSGGTGLGLSIARRIVEAHGGRIELFSEPGRGSDFMIALPVDEPRQ